MLPCEVVKMDEREEMRPLRRMIMIRDRLYWRSAREMSRERERRKCMPLWFWEHLPS